MKKIIILSIISINLAFASQLTDNIQYSSVSPVSSSTDLINAVRNGDLEKVKQSITQKPQEINNTDAQGRTALIIAIENLLPEDKDLAIVQELLKVNTLDIDQADKDGMTPLAIAIENNQLNAVEAILNACQRKPFYSQCKSLEQRDNKLSYTPFARAASSGNDEIIKLLLQAGANPTAPIKKADKTLRASELYTSDNKEILDLLKTKEKEFKDRALKAIYDLSFKSRGYEANMLLDQGIDVNAKKDSDRRTALYWAAFNGHKNIAERLIKAGADVNSQDKEGFTPLHAAAQNGFTEIMKMLIDAGAEVHAKNQYDSTPLHLSASGGQKDASELLISKKADVNAKSTLGNTPLHVAAVRWHAPIVELLIKNGADVNSQNATRMTPLFLAISTGGHQAKDVVDLLLKSKAVVDTKGEGNFTPLHYAAMKGNKDVVQMLIENKADVHAKGYNGETPLDWAKKAEINRQEIIDILKKAGAER